VVGADGSLTGYGGGIERKHYLLAHERRVSGQTLAWAPRRAARSRPGTPLVRRGRRGNWPAAFRVSRGVPGRAGAHRLRCRLGVHLQIL